MIDAERTYLKHYTRSVAEMPDGSEMMFLELPWRNNTISTNHLEASCIPEGIYIVDRNHAGKHQWYALRNEETEPRTFIELHPATRLKHLQGCLAPCLDIKGGARTNDTIAVGSLEACRRLVHWFGEKSWVFEDKKLMDPLTIGSIVGLGRELIGRVWPDPKDQAEELRKLKELEQKGSLAELQAYVQMLQGRMSIIQSEANSEHWLTANWRPIVMLTFTGLIVARWFGLSAEGITEAEYVEIWGILKLGIGGYVIGRSGEKIVREYKKNNPPLQRVTTIKNQPLAL